MLYYIGVFIGSICLTIMVSVAAYSGWLFVSTSTYWLSQVLGAALIAITFLLVTLAFALVRLSADGNN